MKKLFPPPGKIVISVCIQVMALAILFLASGCNTGQQLPPEFFFPTNAVEIFSDDFESGNLNKWTATAPFESLTIDTNFNIWPLDSGKNSARVQSLRDRMHHNIVADNGNKELGGPAIVTFYLFDSGDTNAANSVTNIFLPTFYAGVMAHSGGKGIPNGGTTPEGTLQHLIGVGKATGNGFYTGESSVEANAGMYQVFIQTPSRTGIMALTNAHNRSAGWHRFDIERLEDGHTLKVYLDFRLGRVIQLPEMDTWDTVFMGPGVNANRTGMEFFDGFSVAHVPDTNAPTVAIVHGSFSYDTVTVIYSEQVDDSADDPANYTLDGGVRVLSVERLAGCSVKLHTTRQAPGTNYTLTIGNVQDFAGNKVPAGSNTKTFQAFTYSWFSSTFDSKPENSVLVGNAVVNGGILKLTDPVGNQRGSFKTGVFPGGKTRGFTATFKVFIGDGTGADGMGVSFAQAPDNADVGAEMFFNPSFCITHDTWINTGSQDAPRILLRANGGAPAQIPFLSRVGKWVDVYLQVRPDGTMDYAYNGVPLFTNRMIYTNQFANGRMVFAAQTGGAFDKHWIDDLQITYIPETPDTTAPAVSSVSATAHRIVVAFSEPMADFPALDPANYSIVPDVPVSNISLSSDFTTITLTTSEALDPSVTYTLTLKDLADRANTPNKISPNPSTIEFTPVHNNPAEVGMTLNGYQDDFHGPLSSSWVPHGPELDLYTVDADRGVLVVKGGAGEPDHLLYEAPGYEGNANEVLMRAWVATTGEGPRNGGAVVVAGGLGSTSENLGVNVHFRAAPDISNDLFIQEDASGASGPSLPSSWTEKVPYWIRLKYDGQQVLSKIWKADGDTAEPELAATWLLANFTGFAGITAPYSNPGATLEVDYILIKASGLPEITVRPDATGGTPPPPQVSLAVQRVDGQVSVSWNNPTAVLQEASSAEGPYNDLPGPAISPYTPADQTGKRFYRLRVP